MLRRYRANFDSPDAVWVNFEPHRPGTAPHVHTTRLATAFTELTGKSTRVIGSPRTAGRLARPKRWFAVLALAVIASRRSRLIYARSGPAALLLVLWAKCRRSTSVLEVNGLVDDATMLQALPGWLERAAGLTIAWQIRLADAVVTPTREVAVACRALGAKRTAVVPAGCDVAPIRAVDDELVRSAVTPPARPYLSFVGFLAPWSGVDFVVAASQSPCWPGGIDLVICGDGPLRAEVERAGAPVRYLGLLDHDEAVQILAGSVATFSLKHYRSDKMSHFPMKVIEACAVGVPSLVSDVPAQNRLVRDKGCGLVLPDEIVQDPDAMARLVGEQLPVLTSDAMRQRCREAAAHNSWSDRARALHAFLQGDGDALDLRDEEHLLHLRAEGDRPAGPQQSLSWRRRQRSG